MEAHGEELGAVYALLSRVFLKEVDAELLVELARPAIADVLELFEPGFREFIQAPWDEARFEDEAAEYARLFLMPKGVSPYAASWMDGEEAAIRADLEERITTLYEALKVRPADFGLGNVPSDHIGMLLALTSVALQMEASGGLAAQSLELLTGWAPVFADRLQAESTSPLYRASARLLSEVLAR